MGKVQRKTVNKKTREYTEGDVAIPSVYSAYNYGKVGTDRMDQMVGAYYRNTRFRWHVKLMLHVAMIAMTNAHVTYLDLTHQDRTQLPYLDFVMAVVDELKVTPTSFHKKAKRNPLRSWTGKHTPTYTYGPTQGTKPAAKKAKGARWYGKQCVGCRSNSKTRYKCMECDVHLHINDSEVGYSCWSKYHLHKH